MFNEFLCNFLAVPHHGATFQEFIFSMTLTEQSSYFILHVTDFYNFCIPEQFVLIDEEPHSSYTVFRPLVIGRMDSILERR